MALNKGRHIPDILGYQIKYIDSFCFAVILSVNAVYGDLYDITAIAQRLEDSLVFRYKGGKDPTTHS